MLRAPAGYTDHARQSTCPLLCACASTVCCLWPNSRGLSGPNPMSSSCKRWASLACSRQEWRHGAAGAGYGAVYAVSGRVAPLALCWTSVQMALQAWRRPFDWPETGRCLRARARGRTNDGRQQQDGLAARQSLELTYPSGPAVLGIRPRPEALATRRNAGASLCEGSRVDLVPQRNASILVRPVLRQLTLVRGEQQRRGNHVVRRGPIAGHRDVPHDGDTQ